MYLKFSMNFQKSLVNAFKMNAQVEILRFWSTIDKIQLIVLENTLILKNKHFNYVKERIREPVTFLTKITESASLHIKRPIPISQPCILF